MDMWTFLGRTDLLFSILAASFSGFAALKLRQQNKRLKELAKAAPKLIDFKEILQRYEGIQSLRPMAFSLSLIPRGESIKDNVQTFLRLQGWNMEIEELNMNGITNSEDLETFINNLREKRRLFDALQVTELHLFIAGPVIAAVIIGAMFDNWIPVKLYHKPQPAPASIYEYWLPLMK